FRCVISVLSLSAYALDLHSFPTRRSSDLLVHELSEFLVEQMDSPSDLKRPLLGRRKCRWSAPVPLDRFRTIAQTTNTTINDVLLDRKSTRLNSSHVKISYAVFCLKKKNKQ